MRGRKPGPKPSGDRSWDPGTGPGNAGTGLGDLGAGPGDFGTGPGYLRTGAGVPETGPGVPQVLVLSLSRSQEHVLSLSSFCSLALKNTPVSTVSVSVVRASGRSLCLKRMQRCGEIYVQYKCMRTEIVLRFFADIANYLRTAP